MAIFHMNMNVISRSKGQSATASASYRSGDKIYSERYGQSNFYPREVKPETFIFTPKNAPVWANNRERLWNEVEKVESRKDSQLAREFTVALPIELTNDEQKKLIREYVQNNFVDDGMVADVAIHRDKDKNPHAHVMLTMRPFDENGNWSYKSKTVYELDEKGNKIKNENGNFKQSKVTYKDWDSKDVFKNWRKSWADTTNRYLENNSFSERITEKSFAELSIDKIPTIHEGYVARKMEIRGEVSDRCGKNRMINEENKSKNEARNKAVDKEAQRTISASLSPSEKKQIGNIAKELKTTISYEKFDYSNLIDKQRMVRNWENSTRYNEIITDIGIEEKTLKNIIETKENIEVGTEIMNKQADRIMEKYYPELNQKVNYSSYYKASIAQATIQEDKVLSKEEIAKVLEISRDNRLSFMLKTIVKNPYVKPVAEFQKPLAYNHKKLKEFYSENKVTSQTVSTLSVEKQKEYKSILKKRDFNKDTLSILDKYYTTTIKEKYPSANLSDRPLGEKEALAKAIDYYGNEFSLDKLQSIVQEEQVNKFTYSEQRIGLEMLEKIENNTLTSKEISEFQSDYRYGKIYEVVSDDNLRPIFIDEAQTNNHNRSNKDWNFEGNEYAKHGFVSLFGKVDLLQNITQASQENLRNEKEEKSRRAKLKQKKNPKNKKSNSINQSF